MKKHSLLITLVVCCAFGTSYAQVRTLTEAQLDRIVKPSLANCQAENQRIDAANIIPTANSREFPTERVAKTLHGIWSGKIVGDQNDLGVDYFWIMDLKNNEGLIVALRNGKTTVPGLSAARAANAPKLTYVLCPHEGYVPAKDYSMIHEFVKVSDSIENAPQILEKATGVKPSKAHPSLSEIWQDLLASGYFKTMPATAFAGAMLKPIQLGPIANPIGPASHLVSWNSEYRGGGNTSIKYVTGVPLVGVEHGEFIGTSTKSGDFLVSSPGNGKIWKVEATLPPNAATEGGALDVFPGSCYDLAFDVVTLGPLQK